MNLAKEEENSKKIASTMVEPELVLENNNQSYVLTKGWSWFVKEKRLVAGDIVSFQRGTHNCIMNKGGSTIHMLMGELHHVDSA
ncbi:hypothetical protein SUGI_0432800 [Cryptomeria japonica]|nr:hypothetical protein SUGI_0432800 [Cryptomeria japonica]